MTALVCISVFVCHSIERRKAFHSIIRSFGNKNSAGEEEEKTHLTNFVCFAVKNGKTLSIYEGK